MSAKLQSFKDIIENDDTDILLNIRMTYLWNDELSTKTMSALDEVIIEYRSKNVFPKDVYYFMTTTVTILFRIISNEDFLVFPDDYLLEQNIKIEGYISLVKKRKLELSMLQDKFFSGKLFVLPQA